ncbi:hypothetical protein RyT2_18260 [Pseudolactococcus yaeyamensis]
MKKVSEETMRQVNGGGGVWSCNNCGYSGYASSYGYALDSANFHQAYTRHSVTLRYTG